MASTEQDELHMEAEHEVRNKSFFVEERFSVAAIESMHLYACENLTVTPKIACIMNGTYTKMLRKATNVIWWEHKTNAEV